MNEIQESSLVREERRFFFAATGSHGSVLVAPRCSLQQEAMVPNVQINKVEWRGHDRVACVVKAVKGSHQNVTVYMTSTVSPFPLISLAPTQCREERLKTCRAAEHAVRSSGRAFAWACAGRFPGVIPAILNVVGGFRALPQVRVRWKGPRDAGGRRPRGASFQIFARGPYTSRESTCLHYSRITCSGLVFRADCWR